MKYKSIQGRYFGKLKVISDNVFCVKSKRRMAYCQCDCGKRKEVRVDSLQMGFTKSCGCFTVLRMKSIKKRINEGEVFSRLTVIKEVPTMGRKRHVQCICSCGTVKVIRYDSLKSGAIQSCGCYNKEASKKANTTHGLSYSTEYTSWQSMIERCTNPNHKQYHDYGGKGITICEEWRHSFGTFFKDMGAKPSKQYTIERKNNFGNYTKDNCKWATRAEQLRNYSRNRWIEHDGERMILDSWARKLNTKYQTLSSFLKKHSIEEAIKFYSK
jgi:hypothetical protein